MVGFQILIPPYPVKICLSLDNKDRYNIPCSNLYNIEKEAVIMNERRDKCWTYSRNPDDKNDQNWYILAFVNGKGACSLRRFEAVSGKHLETLYEKGNFQDKFAAWLNPISFPLRIDGINLEKACKEGLPAWAVSEIKKQINGLIISALSSMF
jgi:hypothetical protein